MGKGAVHLGGDLQLMFGILGKRWENNERIIDLRNDHWVYPSKDETPEEAIRVENGCYWG